MPRDREFAWVSKYNPKTVSYVAIHKEGAIDRFCVTEKDEIIGNIYESPELLTPPLS